MNKIDLRSLDIKELKELFVSIGEKSFRGNQVFNWIHEKCIEDIDDITVLSKSLREKIKENYTINSLNIVEKYKSKLDGTRKYLFALKDGNIIESVMMKYKHGISVCLSTQVGCRMGCSFCASTKEGLVRNLEPSEILGQFYSIQKDINEKVSNVVLMGSGEPLDNYKNVLKFLSILHDKEGQNLSYRNITLSTCGVVPKIYKLAEEEIPVNLAISLHSPFNDERKAIMPISNKYTIEEILKACKYYIEKTKRRVTFEYTLIDGINDTENHAVALSKLLENIIGHVNLIPLNKVEEFEHTKSLENSINKFKNTLSKKGINATVRREMGADINAACGQLRRDYINTK